MIEMTWPYGSYLVCLRTDTNGRWQQGDFAAVISKTCAPGVDLLFERGKTLFDLDPATLRLAFKVLFCDPHFVIDGCSANPAWAQARAIVDRQ